MKLYTLSNFQQICKDIVDNVLILRGRSKPKLRPILSLTRPRPEKLQKGREVVFCVVKNLVRWPWKSKMNHDIYSSAGWLLATCENKLFYLDEKYNKRNAGISGHPILEKFFKCGVQFSWGVKSEFQYKVLNTL